MVSQSAAVCIAVAAAVAAGTSAVAGASSAPAVVDADAASRFGQWPRGDGFAAGVVRTASPPMGWRSWNWFLCNVSQDIMAAQVDALVKPRSFGGEPPVSLRDVGYTHAGLDDCWQVCLGPGKGFHGKDGNPVINTTAFPSMAELVQHGTSVNVTMGWYFDNCRCHETNLPTHYAEDAALTERLGWGGVKIDSCGNSRDMAAWATQFAKDGRDLLVESCGNGPAGTNPKKDPTPMPAFVEQLETTCPFSFFRVSVDAAPQFNSLVFNANRAVPYLGAQPLSRPGCWAYADMLEVGVKLTRTESKTHFALWSVISSPLILGFDLTDDAVLESVWDIITNKEVLAVSHAWVAGAPHASGRLVRNSTETFNATVEHGASGARSDSMTLPVWQLWTKPVSATEQAVLAVNNGDTPVTVSFALSELGLPGKVTARDLWAHTFNGTVTGSFSATVAPHDGVFLRLAPAPEEH